MKSLKHLIIFTALIIPQWLFSQNCHPNLYTGWQYLGGTSSNLKLYMNIGCSADVEGFAFNDVTVTGNFSNCIQIDLTRIMYKGVEYLKINNPELFEGFNPSINWATVGFAATYSGNGKTIRISEPIVSTGNRFSNLVSFWSMEEMAEWKRNNPNFTVKKSDFSFSNFKVGDMSLNNCSDIITKIQDLESQKQKKQKLDELYKGASTDFNNNQLEASMQKVREGLSICNSYNITDQRFEDLKKKIEDKLSSNKKEDSKNKLNDLYNKASSAANAGKKSEAIGYINQADQIMKQDQITDTRFADLRKKLDSAAEQQTAKSAPKDTTQSSQSSAKESDSKNSSDQSSSSESQSMQSQETSGPTQAELDAQAERERLARQQDYYKQRNDAISQNTDLASMGAAQILLVYYSLGTVIYSNIDKNPGNIISSPGSSFDLKLGYSISSYPMFINVTNEIFDGNTYTYEKYSEVRNPFSLNMNVQTNVWFMRSSTMGIAATVHGTLGQGLYFQNFQTALNGGLKGYMGLKGIQFCGEYLMGSRNFRYNDWIDAQKVQKGRSQLKYHQLKAGVRFNTEVEWNGTTMLNVEVLPMFEVYRGVNYLTSGSYPMGINWKKGIEVGLKFDNRMSFILQVSEQYPHKGEDLYGFKSYPKLFSTGFSLSVLRSIEYYDNQTTPMSPENIRYYLSKLEGDEIRFLSPVMEYLTPGKSLSSPRPSIQSVKIFEYRHNHEIADFASIGYGGNIGFTSLIFNNKTASNVNFLTPATENTLSNVYLSIPAELKLYLPQEYNTRKWIAIGATYRKNVYSGFSYRESSSDKYKQTTKDHFPLTTDGLFWTAAIGMDYAVGNSIMTTGIQYKRATQLLTPLDKCRIQGLELVFGVKI